MGTKLCRWQSGLAQRSSCTDTNHALREKQETLVEGTEVTETQTVLEGGPAAGESHATAFHLRRQLCGVGRWNPREHCSLDGWKSQTSGMKAKITKRKELTSVCKSTQILS